MTIPADVREEGARGATPFERLAALWGREPSEHLQGMNTAMSAAIWRFEPDRVHDVVGDRDPTLNIVSAPIRGLSTSTYFGDGRQRYTRQLRPFDLNIVPAGESPRALLSAAEEFSYIHIYVPGALLLGLVEQSALDTGTQVELIDPEGAQDPGLIALIQTAAQEMRSGRPLSRMALDALGQSLAIHLLRWHSNKAGSASMLTQAQAVLRGDWRFRRAAEFLQSHLGNDVGLAEAAAVVGLSTTHLTKLFKLNAGEAPYRWLMRQRFLRACDLLHDRHLRVTEVAHACEIASSQHLATVFSKRLGMTPRQYRMRGPS